MGRIVRKRTQQKKENGSVRKASRTAKNAVCTTAKRDKKSGSEKKTGSPRRLVKRRTARQIERTITEFRSIVNIPGDQLERWLNTSESKKLHLPDEPTGGNGNSILSLLKKRRDKYSENDFDRMEIVVRFVKQRLEKRPKGDIVASNWRYSLMNWGHDPTRKMKRVEK